jgi:putative nucleotidyltransferase with HDIG domain
MRLPFPCPEPGDSIDWGIVDHPWTAPMRVCPQDPEYHAEGDVWTHTRMVCEALVGLPEWAVLEPAARETLFAAALLHDVGKPATTQEIDGRVRSPGHSAVGASMARQILWDLEAPLQVRERVACLIRHHQTPFFLIDSDDPLRKAAHISLSGRCDQLAILSRADALGRVCAKQSEILANVALFEEFCLEERCLDRPWPFPSDHSRFVYFRTPGRDPRYEAYDDTRAEVVLMSGLPGAGKSSWVAENLDLPVISLDRLRAELRVSPQDHQGPVLSRARELATGYLRAAEPFVWDATNLSRDSRTRPIGLFAAYNARVRIVYVDAPRSRLLLQNRAREGWVPEHTLERLTHQWQVPDLTEAHRVDWIE